ncbi:MAG: RNA polymerase sigma factor [Myxococcota bacterium]
MATLVPRVLAGEERAVRELFLLLTPSLLRVARGVLGRDHPDVEDVVQDALVRVLRALPSFRGEGGIRHFACRIAVRATSDFVRRRRNQPFLSLDSEALEATPVPDAAEARRRKLLMELLLQEISENQAETLIMRAVLGYSIEEIAEATGAPMNTVRSRLRLSKDAIRRRVESDPGMSELLKGGRGGR